MATTPDEPTTNEPLPNPEPTPSSEWRSRRWLGAFAWISLVLVVGVSLGADTRLRLDELPPVDSVAGTGALDGHATCTALYESFRTQAQIHGIAAIPLFVLAFVAALLVALVAPVVAPVALEPTASVRSMLTSAIRSQPRISLAALAALLGLCAHHRVSVQDGARELAAAAIDAMTSEPGPNSNALHRRCMALRAEWERRRGDATKALVRSFEAQGASSGRNQSARDVAQSASHSAKQVRSKAVALVDTGRSPADQLGALRALLDDQVSVTTSVKMADLAIDAAKREGAPTPHVERWRSILDESAKAAAGAHDQGRAVLAEQPMMGEPTPEDVAAVSVVASELAAAVGKVEVVSDQVEDFLREGTVPTQSP